MYTTCLDLWFYYGLWPWRWFRWDQLQWVCHTKTYYGALIYYYYIIRIAWSTYKIHRYLFIFQGLMYCVQMQNFDYFSKLYENAKAVISDVNFLWRLSEKCMRKQSDCKKLKRWMGTLRFTWFFITVTPSIITSLIFIKFNTLLEQSSILPRKLDWSNLINIIYLKWIIKLKDIPI